MNPITQKNKKPIIAFISLILGILAFLGPLYLAVIAIAVGLFALFICIKLKSRIWMVIIALLLSLLSIGFHLTKYSYLKPITNFNQNANK
jgi:hypothetical protein